MKNSLAVSEKVLPAKARNLNLRKILRRTQLRNPTKHLLIPAQLDHRGLTPFQKNRLMKKDQLKGSLG
jgi:hypothetical protein